MRPHRNDCALPLITCVVIFVTLAFGQSQMMLGSRSTTKSTLPSPELAAQMVARENAVWEAAKQRDMRRFADLVADDARMVFVSGIMTKQEYMRAASARTITEYSLNDFQVFMPAKGIVITFYKATVSGTTNGKAFAATAVRESSLWVHRDQKWVAVWNQETPIQ